MICVRAIHRACAPGCGPRAGEARELKHNYIGTEHILLGLLREREGVAARVLESLGITVERVRAQVVRIVGSGEEVSPGQIPFTPRAKKILELALREARSLGHNYVGTEHILLGVVRENEGVAARILSDFDADPEKIRNAVILAVTGSEEPKHGATTGPSRAGDFRLVVRPDRDLQRLLMAAGGRALTNERHEFGLSDLLAVAREIHDARTQTDADDQEPGQSDT